MVKKESGKTIRLAINKQLSANPNWMMGKLVSKEMLEFPNGKKIVVLISSFYNPLLSWWFNLPSVYQTSADFCLALVLIDDISTRYLLLNEQETQTLLQNGKSDKNGMKKITINKFSNNNVRFRELPHFPLSRRLETILLETIEIILNEGVDVEEEPTICAQEKTCLPTESAKVTDDEARNNASSLHDSFNELLSDIEAYICNNDEQLTMIRKKIDELRDTYFKSK